MAIRGPGDRPAAAPVPRPQPRRVVVVELAGVGVDLADVGPALALDILLQVPELAKLHDDVQLLCTENSLPNFFRQFTVKRQRGPKSVEVTCGQSS